MSVVGQSNIRLNTKENKILFLKNTVDLAVKKLVKKEEKFLFMQSPKQLQKRIKRKNII